MPRLPKPNLLKQKSAPTGRFFKTLLSLFFIGCFSTLNTLQAQKEDYVWMSGYDSYAGYDSSWGFYFGASVLDFNVLPLTAHYDSIEANFCRTNVSFCDDQGGLLFYSNGITVYNRYNEKVQNGDSLGLSYLQLVEDPSEISDGRCLFQGMIALAKPSSPNLYGVIYSFYDTLDQVNQFNRRTLYVELDISANQGHGVVIQRDIVLLEDTLSSNLSAVRHANGRDWWILVQKRNTNCYYRILYDPQGQHILPDLTCIGDAIQLNTYGNSCYSPDGSRFIYLSLSDGLFIYDFNRCSGELGNSIHVPLPVLVDSFWYSIGVAVSPSNQFLYVSATTQVYQYDLWSADIASSKVVVANYDGYQSPLGSYFGTEQLAPDGKIYISCGNTETKYHVINSPDQKGSACDFKYHTLQLPSPSFTVPNFPNYRLGPLIGSPCDTLGLSVSEQQKEKQPNIYPNPATAFVTIDYGFTNWNKGNVGLQIINGIGQLMYEGKLPPYSGFQKVDVSHFAKGIYLVTLKQQGRVTGNARFVKE